MIRDLYGGTTGDMMNILAFGISGIFILGVLAIGIILFILTIVFGTISAIKKTFKKTFIVLFIATILFGIFDFVLISNIKEIFHEADINSDEDLNVRIEDGKVILSDNPLEQLIMSDDQKTEILCKDIIDKIETKDCAAIKNIFSEDMIGNVSNLDEGINKLIDISNETIIDFTSLSNGSETHWDSGKHRTTYRFTCNITTKAAKYSIGFEYDYENPFNSETLGVNRMVILDENGNVLVLVDNETINKGY